MLNDRDIMAISLEQSARDMNCKAEDFLKPEPVILEGGLGAGCKRYYKEPVSCNFVSYGSNVVALCRPEYSDVVREYTAKFEYYHLFETPNVHWLSEKLEPMGQKVCFMAEYYLPNLQRLRRLPIGYETRVLTQEDFVPLYVSRWENALCESRKELDVLGVGAYHRGKLVGLAACSADADRMWQIGVDVLPEYRQQGIAAALTGALTFEILERGKVPFYCTAWSNIRSARNAVRCGFFPAWAEMTVKPAPFVDRMNSED